MPCPGIVPLVSALLIAHPSSSKCGAVLSRRRPNSLCGEDRALSSSCHFRSDLNDDVRTFVLRPKNALAGGRTLKVEEVVARGDLAALNEADKHGQTPLHLACYKVSVVGCSEDVSIYVALLLLHVLGASRVTALQNVAPAQSTRKRKSNIGVVTVMAGAFSECLCST